MLDCRALRHVYFCSFLPRASAIGVVCISRREWGHPPLCQPVDYCTDHPHSSRVTRRKTIRYRSLLPHSIYARGQSTTRCRGQHPYLGQTSIIGLGDTQVPVPTANVVYALCGDPVYPTTWRGIRNLLTFCSLTTSRAIWTSPKRP